MQHSHLQRWGAAYLLLGLFLASWLGQLVMGVQHFTSEAETHGEAFEWGAFLPYFLTTTFENWQSEWLQLLVQAVVLLGMKHMIFAADAEDMEVVQRDLVAIKQALGLKADEPGERHQTG